MTQDKAQAAGAVSIDSPKFRELLVAYRHELVGYQEEARQKVFAFADAHAAQRYEAGHQAGLTHAVQTIANSNDTASIALKQRDEAQASLARLVEAMNEIIRNDPFNTHNSSIIARAALLPAKTDAETREANRERLQRKMLAMPDIEPAVIGGGYIADFPQGDSFEAAWASSGASNAELPHKGIARRWFTLGQATPAPAMGEELPPLSDEDAQIIATFEQHIDKDLDTSPGVTSYWIKQSEVVEAVRACMALRQTGAVEVGGLTKAEIGDTIQAIKAAITPTGMFFPRGWNVLLNKLQAMLDTPAAPVSQPAAQEVLQARSPEVTAWEDVDAVTYVHAEANGFEVRKLYTASAPLSAPAGSEQEVDLTTKQGKLLALADRIDHEKLWRIAGIDHHKLTSEQKDRMNAAVALRRYADIWTPGRWIVVAPTGNIQFGAATLDKAVEMAKREQQRRAAQQEQSK